MWVKNCIRHRLSLMGGDSYRNALLIKGLLSTAEMERLRIKSLQLHPNLG